MYTRPNFDGVGDHHPRVFFFFFTSFNAIKPATSVVEAMVGSHYLFGKISDLCVEGSPCIPRFPCSKPIFVFKTTKKPKTQQQPQHQHFHFKHPSLLERETLHLYPHTPIRWGCPTYHHLSTKIHPQIILTSTKHS